MSYLSHPLITDETIELREYQEYLSKQATKESSLIVLPTGTGKTIVTLLVTANRIRDNPNKTSLLLAPTKPLVQQHYDDYSEFLDISEDQIIQLTGDIRPDNREEIWNRNPSMIIATPKVIENDLISDRISLETVSHLTFDECHRAKGEYSYVYIADKYMQQSNEALITGLSASPGDDKETVLQICKNIHVKNIEVMTSDDEMLQKHIHETEIEPKFLDVHDDVLEIRDIMQELYKKRLKELKDRGYIDQARKTTSIGKLQQCRSNIQEAMNKGEDDAYSAMSIWAECMKISRAVTLIESQGTKSFSEYMSRLQEEANSADASRAVERIIKNADVNEAIQIAKNHTEKYKKFEALRSELVRTIVMDNGKALVFTKSRDTVEALVDELSDDFNVGRLVGQQDKQNSAGMKQSEQKEAIQKFSDGIYDVLISTQVGEEGLDIPQVDCVVFYEPVSKGIETIQRQGRTGRSEKGRVVILIAKNTRDEGMYYRSKSNQKQMKQDMDGLKKIDDLQNEIEEELQKETKQATLDSVVTADSMGETPPDEDIDSTVSEEQSIGLDSTDSEDQIVILPDSRETNSSIVRNLDMDDDVVIQSPESLDVGDYILSDDCAVERKSADDFHDTITGNRSLFEQIQNLTNSYAKPILLIEGSQGELYSKNIHENAIRGALASVVVDYGVSIIYSTGENDTGETLKQIAKREQTSKTTEINPHGNKKTKNISEEQLYIVSSIGDIGPSKAKDLLREFGSVKEIFDANIDELTAVAGIGEKTANKIYSIVRESY